MATILELVQAACYEGNIAAPSTLVGSSLDLSTLQLVHLTYATGRELRAARVWPQLKRTYQFMLESGRTAYRLPVDFYATLPNTEYARDRSALMQPLTDPEWNARIYGYGTSCIGREFRIFGPDTADAGQFHVSPAPGSSDADAVLSYEYISANWLSPASGPVLLSGPVIEWMASRPVTSGQLVSANDNVYAANSSGFMGSVPPSVDGDGIGSDGGVRWQYVGIFSWEADTIYAVGDLVQNINDRYIATTAGTSAPSGGPTGTGTNIVDGTVRWSFLPVATWTPSTSYTAGSYAVAGNYYCAVTSGTSGSNAPNWVPTLDTFMQADSDSPSLLWILQYAIPTLYPKILSDTDISLLDDELMIGGLKWRFLRARGLEYQDLKLEYEMHKDAAVGRLTPMQKLSLAGNGYGSCYPRVPEGGWVL